MTGSAQREFGSSLGALITVTAIAATAAIGATLPASIEVARTAPLDVLAVLALTLVLQGLSVEVYGRGHLGVSAIGILIAGFAFGPGTAALVAALAGTLQWLRHRRLPHRGLFDVSNFAVSGAAAGAAYAATSSPDSGALALLAAGTLAGVVYNGVNTGVLSLAMGLAEGEAPAAIWRERFGWARYHFLAYGPLAVAAVVAYDAIGLLGLLAFAVPPAALMLSVRQYLQRTRSAVEDVRHANDELRRANADLADANADLQHLFELATGLGARAHDRRELLTYVESTVSALAGTAATVVASPGAEDVALVAGDRIVGGLVLADAPAVEHGRWERLRDAFVPTVATALESATLVERVNQTHLATIAALSRSMEVKDLYTGGHTERVSKIASAIASQLGYEGADLVAIEIGALLHDIGKIGVPEAILQKDGPLTDDEWAVVKQHPLISEYILADVDLPPIVRQITRWSHERIDGRGYPDALAGEEIPLPARIVLAADAFDAITSNRPYRSSRSVAAALDEIGRNAGSQFCPRVTAALAAVYAKAPHVLTSGTLHAVRVA